MPFFDSTRPLVFAHRGGCALGPENTIAAFDLGVASGADGIECDVHLSADGVAVVCHDARLDRTTNRTGPVAALTAAELERVDAGCRFEDPGRQAAFAGRGIGIPTLRQVLRRYPDRRVIIEMKVDSAEMGAAVASEVRAAGAVERACAAGEGARSVGAVRRLMPELATSACHPEARMAVYRSLAGWPVNRAGWPGSKVPYGGYQVPERAGWIRVVSPRFVRQAHRAGLRVQVWTVDEEADMCRLLAWGVDGLISNRPDVAVTVRDAFVAPRA